MRYFGITFIILCCVFYRIFVSLTSLTSGILLLGILLLFTAILTLTRKSAFQFVIWGIIVLMSGGFHFFHLSKSTQTVSADSPTALTQNTFAQKPLPADKPQAAPVYTGPENPKQNAALLTAIKENNPARVKELLRSGANPNAKTTDGRPAINEAFMFVGEWTQPILEALLQAGADVNSSYHTFTPLMLATSMRQEKLVDFLLANGADVNAQQERTALMLAAESGNISIAQKLIQAGGDVNKNYRNYTALQEAIHKNNLPMVEFLVNNGADVNFENTWAKALLWGTPDIIKILVNKGMSVPQDSQQLALKAYQGDLDFIKTWFTGVTTEKNGVRQLDWAKIGNETTAVYALLDWAIAGGQTQTARFILDQAVNLNLPNSFEMAGAYGRTEILKQILSSNVSLTEKSYLTALKRAVEHGHADTAQVLLEKGINPNKPAPDSFGISFLQIAARRGDAAMVRTLLSAKANPNQTNPVDNDTALLKAVESGNLETVKALVEAGADIRMRNNWGQTPLKLAVQTGQKEMAAFLRQTGATE